MNELFLKGLENLNEKIDSLRQIQFTLNDNEQNLIKTYYFTFEQVENGNVAFEVEKLNGKVELFLEDIPIFIGGEFYLKKGVHQIKVQATLVENQTVTVTVKGRVKYYSTSTVKVLNANNYSVIAVFDGVEVTIYKYADKVERIDSVVTFSYDIMLLGEELILYYVTDSGYAQKTYVGDLLSCVVENFNVANLAQIKCHSGEKVGLYGVKEGFLHKIDCQNGETDNLGVRVKNLFTVDSGKVVFRDFDNKIKLCRFSVSP